MGNRIPIGSVIYPIADPNHQAPRQGRVDAYPRRSEVGQPFPVRNVGKPTDGNLDPGIVAELLCPTRATASSLRALLLHLQQ